MTIKERKSNMNKLIRDMLKHEKLFDMQYFMHIPGEIDYSETIEQVLNKNLCGTSFCIGGFCAILENQKARIYNAGSHSAKDWLGLESDIARALTLPSGSDNLIRSKITGHNCFHIDVNIAIKAVRMAVRMQNARDKKNESL